MLEKFDTSEGSKQLAIASDFEFVAVIVLVVITFLKPSFCRISLYYHVYQLVRNGLGADSHIGKIHARENDA